LEVLVVDDCSTDDSARVARAMGATVIRTPGNGGAAVARNTGADHAQGEILFFLDADVALAPDSIANGVAMLAADPALGAVGGVEDPEPLVPGSRVNDYRGLQYHHWAHSTQGDVTVLSVEMCAMRAEVYRNIGPFNPKLRQTDEVDYGQRLSRRYGLRVSSAIHGRQDYDHEVVPLLKKLFRRSRLRVPLYVDRRGFARGYETSTRAFGALAALLAVVTVPVPLLAGPEWAAVPGALLVLSMVSDAEMYRFVLRRRGPVFLGYFSGLHFLVNVTIASGAAVGALHWLVSTRFRRLYDPPRPAVAGAGG
jgi:glycosyltransferase involved in cell wall biosynthesis